MNIKEIAKAAGVSVATISRALNHPEQVLPETRERVLAIMRENNYTPNWFARGLNLGRTNTIALLVPSIENHLYRKLISGIETIARNKSYAVILCHTESNPERELEYLRMVKSRSIDGVILVSSALERQQLAALQSPRTPAVHVGKTGTPGFDALCYIDFEECAFRLTQHLLSLGRRRITLLADEKLRGECGQIESGCKRALESVAGAEPLGVLSCGNSVQDGYMATQRMLLMPDAEDRAILTFSDTQAFGALKAANDSHVAVPEQLAIASMMDSAMCGIVNPPVTSVELPGARLGMVAARMLFDAIENQELAVEPPREIVLQPKLKIRRSCGNRKYIYELFD